MLLGVCSNIKNINLAEAAGCDYLEIFFTDCAEMTDEEFADALKFRKSSGIPVYSTHNFIPERYKLTGPCVSLCEVSDYIEKGMDRARQLGVQCVVFGSSGARKVVEGFALDQAFSQLIDFLNLAATVARRNQIKIAIEPLCYKECNIIYSVADALELAEAANLENVGVLADLYHMHVGKEDTHGILRAQNRLFHCHLSFPEDRSYPKFSHNYDYNWFFSALKSVGYQGGVSIEAMTGDFKTEIAEAVQVIRSYM